MKRLLIASAALVAVLALAACGGGGGDSGNSSDATPSKNSTVSVEQLGEAGRVLVDPAGKALYAPDEEADSGVLCTGACLPFWQPLTIDAGAPTADSAPGALGVSERPDGTRQVTLDGKRLYTFTEDEPGEVTGDGFADTFDGQTFTWHVLRAGGGPDSGGGGTIGGGPYG